MAALNERVIGMPLSQLRRVPLVVAGVSGPPDKSEAILAALQGHLVHVLITDARRPGWSWSAPRRRRPPRRGA